MTSLSSLRLLAGKATPGPWHASEFCKAPATEKHPAIDTSKIRPLQRTALGSLKTADAEYISALSPAFVLKMVAVVEAAAKLIDESPQDDKDRPYISEVCGSEFDALAKAIQQLRSASEGAA